MSEFTKYRVIKHLTDYSNRIDRILTSCSLADAASLLSFVRGLNTDVLSELSLAKININNSIVETNYIPALEGILKSLGDGMLCRTTLDIQSALNDARFLSRYYLEGNEPPFSSSERKTE